MLKEVHKVPKVRKEVKVHKVLLEVLHGVLKVHKDLKGGKVLKVLKVR